MDEKQFAKLRENAQPTVKTSLNKSSHFKAPKVQPKKENKLQSPETKIQNLPSSPKTGLKIRTRTLTQTLTKSYQDNNLRYSTEKKEVTPPPPPERKPRVPPAPETKFKVAS